MRLLVGQGYVPPSYDVEWHFYSAEEGGMLGSGEIAQSWAKEKGSVSHEAHNVRGMLQVSRR
jgi:leucyl aminopeptidase